MSTSLAALPASGYATPQSITSTSSTSLPSAISKAPPKPKPVNVFSNDGSFLERFQNNKQEDENKRKAEEALVKKMQFADRFKKRGKRPPPPDSSRAVTSTDLDSNPAKKTKLNDTPQYSEYKSEVSDRAGRVHKDTKIRPLAK